MLQNKSLWIGSLMLLFLLLVMIMTPYMPMVDPQPEEDRIVIDDDGTIHVAPFPPSLEYPFGTDDDGRDWFSLMILGIQDTLFIVFAVTLIRYIIAIPLALLASNGKGPAYYLVSGWHHLFSGLPTIFSVVLLLNLPFFVFTEHRLLWAILIIALIEVGRVAYIFQQQSQDLSQQLFVQAGVTVGNGPIGIYSRYYFPFLLPAIAVNFFLDMGRVLLLMGQLGIIGFFLSHEFVQLQAGMGELVNTSNDWATLLAETRRHIYFANTLGAYWIPFFPAFFIAFTIVSFNLIGEGLRKWFERHNLSV